MSANIVRAELGAKTQQVRAEDSTLQIDIARKNAKLTADV